MNEDDDINQHSWMNESIMLLAWLYTSSTRLSSDYGDLMCNLDSNLHLEQRLNSRLQVQVVDRAGGGRDLQTTASS